VRGLRLPGNSAPLLFEAPERSNGQISLKGRIIFFELLGSSIMVAHILDTSSKSVKIDQLNVVPIEQDAQTTSEHSRAIAEGLFAVIDSRKFFGECIRRSVQSAFTKRVETYSSVADFENKRPSTSIALIVMSLSEDSIQAAADALQALSGLAPRVPIVVLSDKSDLEFARAMMGRGAKGYIPVTMGFEIAIEAIRFVLAGGTYVPVDFFFTPNSLEVAPQRRWSTPGVVTARELAVVRAIQQGKPNKVIASELDMCESTVKVHVRHIMKKLAAKNRTDVAIKSAGLMCSRCTTYSECWAAGRCSSLTSSSASGVLVWERPNRRHSDVAGQSSVELAIGY
jgi:DNA-binding NarL/FixJ family response regulator